MMSVFTQSRLVAIEPPPQKQHIKNDNGGYQWSVEAIRDHDFSDIKKPMYKIK